MRKFNRVSIGSLLPAFARNISPSGGVGRGLGRVPTRARYVARVRVKSFFYPFDVWQFRVWGTVA